MRKLIPLTTATVIIGALCAGVAASSGAATATNITCNSTQYNPTPTQPSGVVFQFTRCSKPFGHGVVSARYTSTFDSTTGAGTANGPFTKWFLIGTVHGRYSQKFQFTSDTDATYESTITISRGTGAFAGVKGNGSERCSTSDAGATLTCTEALELTGV
jgi:hypothetical protein